MKTTKTNATNETMNRLDPALRKFLRSVKNGQSIDLAAWAARILRARRISDTDLGRCFELGFCA